MPAVWKDGAVGAERLLGERAERGQGFVGRRIAEVIGEASAVRVEDRRVGVALVEEVALLVLDELAQHPGQRRVVVGDSEQAPGNSRWRRGPASSRRSSAGSRTPRRRCDEGAGLESRVSLTVAVLTARTSEAHGAPAPWLSGWCRRCGSPGLTGLSARGRPGVARRRSE